MVEIIRRYITGEDIKEARIERLLTVARSQPVEGHGTDQLIEFFEQLQQECRDNRSRR